MCFANLDGVHRIAALLVVCGIDENFVKDLVEARHVGYFTLAHASSLQPSFSAGREAFVAIAYLIVQHKGTLRTVLHAANVRIGAQQDLLEQRLAGVHLLDRLQDEDQTNPQMGTPDRGWTNTFSLEPASS